MCEGLQAQVEQLLNHNKWLTDRNYELGQKLSSLYLARRTFHNGHYELIQEEEEEPNNLAVKFQRRIHAVNTKVELVQEQMIQKEQEFEQAIQMEKRQNLNWQHKFNTGVKLQEKIAHETVKNLMEEVNDLRQYKTKTFAIAQVEKTNRQAELEAMTYKSKFNCEKKSFNNYKKHMEQLIDTKDKLLLEMEHTKKREVIQRTAECTKEIHALTDKNTELSCQQRDGQQLQTSTLNELDSLKLQIKQHLNTITMQENSLIQSHEIQSKLEAMEWKLKNIINSKDLEIIHLRNLITELEEKNNEVNVCKDRFYEKWKNALMIGCQQAAMIREMQDDIRLKAGKNNAMVEELAVVKEQHCDLSNQLKSVQWQLAESRKALDVCVTSAVNERALDEKKMAAEMAAEKEKLEKELQRHKELLEEGNKQVENEQLRQKRHLMKYVVLPNKTPLPLIPNQSPSEDIPKVQVEIGQKSRHTHFPLFKKSTIQPKDTSQARPASSNLPASWKRKQSAPSPTQISSQTPSDVDQKTEKSRRWQLQKSRRVLDVCVTDSEWALGKKKMAEMELLKISPALPTCQARPASSSLLASRKRKQSAPSPTQISSYPEYTPLPSIPEGNVS